MSSSWGHVANFGVQGTISMNIYKMGEWSRWVDKQLRDICLILLLGSLYNCPLYLLPCYHRE